MRTCETCRYYMASPLQEPCESCHWDSVIGQDPTNWKAPTNADRIRSMTDEELAAAMVHFGECGKNCPMHAYCETRTYPRACSDTLLEWLQREVTDEQ